MPGQHTEGVRGAATAEKQPGRGQECRTAKLEAEGRHGPSVDVTSPDVRTPAIEAVALVKRFSIRAWLPWRTKAAVDALLGDSIEDVARMKGHVEQRPVRRPEPEASLPELSAGPEAD